MNGTYTATPADDQAFQRAYDIYFGEGKSQKEYRAAAEEAKRLADKGHSNAMALYGLIRLEGKAAEKDPVQAHYWLERAAAGGNSWAQRMLGRNMLIQDAPFGDNLWLGRYWLEKAAKQNDGYACRLLGESWYNDEDSPDHMDKAIHWYEKGAGLGDIACQSKAATIYMGGKGVEMDPERAARWTKALAEQGVDFAQHTLGWMYRAGFGVKADLREACRWYALAAEQGREDAMKKIREIQAENADNLNFIYGHDLEAALRGLAGQDGDDGLTA